MDEEFEPSFEDLLSSIITACNELKPRIDTIEPHDKKILWKLLKIFESDIWDFLPE